MKLYLSCFLMMFTAAGIDPVSESSNTGGCQDFLSSLHRKPSYIQFIDCKQRFELQDSPFEATYRIDGVHAADAEMYLRKVFRIKKLRRTCCVWESSGNFYRSSRNMYITISMAT